MLMVYINMCVLEGREEPMRSWARGLKTAMLLGRIVEGALKVALVLALGIGWAACGSSAVDSRDARSAQKKCSEERKQFCFDRYVKAVDRCERESCLELRMSLCRSDALIAFEECLAHAGCRRDPEK